MKSIIPIMAIAMALTSVSVTARKHKEPKTCIPILA